MHAFWRSQILLLAGKSPEQPLLTCQCQGGWLTGGRAELDPPFHKKWKRQRFYNFCCCGKHPFPTNFRLPWWLSTVLQRFLAMCWQLHVTSQTKTQAAGCCMTVHSFSCTLSIFSTLPEGLDHLGATQYLVGLNPIEAECCVQLILLFYLLHRELPWKVSCNCKSLGGELATSMSSAVFDTTQRASLPALQRPTAAPNAGKLSRSSRQQWQCHHGNFTDNLMHVCTNQKTV